MISSEQRSRRTAMSGRSPGSASSHHPVRKSPDNEITATAGRASVRQSMQQKWMDERGGSPALARSFERSSGAGLQVGTMDGPGGMVVMVVVQDLVGRWR